MAIVEQSIVFIRIAVVFGSHIEWPQYYSITGVILFCFSGILVISIFLYMIV